MSRTIRRHAILITGVVQGVGFRPFIYQLATKYRLQGSVRNRSDGLYIEVEGDATALDGFSQALTSNPPKLARIDRVQTRQLVGGSTLAGFHIGRSETSADHSVFVSPDVATCADCLRELFDPADRRYLYPFINCTNCGPRFTIITGVPYDREQTTLAAFKMCADCRAEYENPIDRRFHAQPIACPRCGPHLQMLSADGEPISAIDPVDLSAEFIRCGKIIALKGLGGVHLVCDATDEAAVARLRSRKKRDEKPFAVMVADVGAAQAFCKVSPEERDLLVSPERPIVLLRKRSAHLIANSVAPANPYLGVMLPYTPVHHVLIRQLSGLPLVMTSGNVSDEPIVFRDADLIPRLLGVADVFLTNNRPIHFRCDDSVAAGTVGDYPILVRRSRGYAPAAITLPVKCMFPVLALGGQLKATFALGQDKNAVLSHHLGDLDNYSAFAEYERSITHYRELFDFTPQVLVCDLHPDYASTRYSQERAGDLRRLAVQHHHAHMASCMAEHGLVEPVIGVTFDGTGYGLDGTVWGGEFLVGDYAGFTRAAHLRCVRMPGGERAIREPWRMALAHLMDADVDCAGLLKNIPQGTLRAVRDSLRKGLNAPFTSSCGRLFDAAQALIGLRATTTYEGQAAMELEWAATDVEPCGTYPFVIAPGDPLIIDTRPLIRAVVEDGRSGIAPNVIARRVHSTVAEFVLRVCRGLREKFAFRKVVLSGGVFMNRILLHDARIMLERADFEVFSHRQVPANDGGLCLGQLAIAAARTT
jgi:hydrogenase maturation protein HypF